MTATTPDAATTVRRLLEAFLSGDMETLMSCADDEIEWNPAQHNPVITRQYRGREQWLNGAVAAVAAGFEGFRFDIGTGARVRRRSGHRAVLPRHRQEQRTSLRRASGRRLGSTGWQGDTRSRVHGYLGGHERLPASELIASSAPPVTR